MSQLDPPLRRSLPPLPRRMRSLPVDPRGYPVPFFVGRLTPDGPLDFRIADRAKFAACVNDRRCWLCGQALGRWTTFVTGPMCTINRVSAEPPCHYECALFAAQACPFLSLPKSKRNDSGIPSDDADLRPPGEFIKGNPGITALWSTQAPYALVEVDRGVLFRMPTFERLEWWTEGRPATEAEALAAITKGVAMLRAACVLDSTEAAFELEQFMIEGAIRYPMLATVLADG